MYYTTGIYILAELNCIKKQTNPNQTILVLLHAMCEKSLGYISQRPTCFAASWFGSHL